MGANLWLSVGTATDPPGLVTSKRKGCPNVPDQPTNYRRSRGANVLMLLILLVLVGGGLLWAFSESPPDAPQPSGTAAPPTVPQGAPPSGG